MDEGRGGDGADCGGAVDSLRAGLAWRLGDHAEAVRLAEAGLALDARVGSPGWVKRSTCWRGCANHASRCQLRTETVRDRR